MKLITYFYFVKLIKLFLFYEINKVSLFEKNNTEASTFIIITTVIELEIKERRIWIEKYKLEYVVYNLN